jgi:hypothetical protein
VEVVADTPNYHLPAVETYPDLHLDPMLTTEFFSIAMDGFLHNQGGIASPDRVILMGKRSPKQGHDSITQNLVHGSLVSVNRLHHRVQDRVQKPSSLFGIESCQQFHGTLDVGEEDGDLFALTFQGRPGLEDLLSSMGRDVALDLGFLVQRNPACIGRSP